MPMSTLNTVSLFINLVSAIIGVVAYSLVATSSESVTTIIFTLLALLSSFIGSKYVTQHLSRSGPTDISGCDAPISAAKLILFVPVGLCVYEVVALMWINVDPSSVSWAHFAAASTVGYNMQAAVKE